MNLIKFTKIMIVFLLIVLIGIGGYVFFRKKTAVPKVDTNKQSKTTEKKKPDRKTQIEAVMDIVMNDPEIIIAMINPKVRSAFQDIQTNPANVEKYEDDPEIGPLIEKVITKLEDKNILKPENKKPLRKQPSTNVSKPIKQSSQNNIPDDDFEAFDLYRKPQQEIF